MFTWICPKCGREVPPAYTDCPDCNPQTAPAGPPPPAYAAPPQQPYAPPAPPPYAAPPQQPYPAPPSPAQRRPIWQSAPPAPPAPPPPAYPAPPSAPPPPAYAAPPQQPYVAPPPPPPPQAYVPPPPPPQPYIAPPPPPVPEPRSALWNPPPAPPPRARMTLPTWLMAVLFVLAFAGLLIGAYSLLGSHGPSASQTAPDASLNIPASAPGAKANPYQKFIEISGIRFAEDPKNKDKSIVKFVITNHADDQISGLSGSVAIVGRGDKTGTPLASFTFVTTLGPEESKDLTTSLTTNQKAYELPDWQFAQPLLQITAPGGASGGSQ